MQHATDIAYLLLRVVSGLIFFWSGGLILFGWFGGMPGAESPPPVMTQTFLGGVIEFFGGAAILLGLFTRPAAFLCSGTMAVAYWQFHAPTSIWPIENQGAPAILLCFVFLYISARGGEAWSLDAILPDWRRAARGNTERGNG